MNTDANRSPDRRRRHRGTAAILVLLTLLAACSGADDSATDSAVEAPAMDRDWAEGGAAADGETGEYDEAVDDAAPGGVVGGTTGEPVPAPELAALGRERIRTAWITLELEDPEAAVAEVADAAEANGGFVALADLARDDRTGELHGTVTVRVPSSALLETLDAFEALAVDAPVRRIEEQDVGSQLTDLRAQLTNLTAYEGELRELLTEVRTGTSDPDDLLPIVERLQSVRSDIDRIRAQRDGLEERVALSTITVTLTSTRSAAPIPTSSWAPLRTFQEAIAATGRALAAVADAAIWLLVTALPIALILLVPPLLVWRWLRRRSDAVPSHPAPSGPPTVGPVPPPAG